MYTQIKHQAEREISSSPTSFLNDKDKLSRLTNTPTETLRHPLTRLTLSCQSQCTQKHLFMLTASCCVWPLFPVSGGFGGGFNGGGDGGNKGRKVTGDATANKPPAAKKPRTCGICHTPGHTRVTCPQRWLLLKDTTWSHCDFKDFIFQICRL